MGFAVAGDGAEVCSAAAEACAGLDGAAAELVAAAGKPDESVRLRGIVGQMIDLIAGVVADQEQFHRYLIKEKDSVTYEKHYEKMDTHMLRELTGTVKDLFAIVREFGERSAGAVEPLEVTFEADGEVLAE
jgi:hypothetical protein